MIARAIHSVYIAENKSCITYELVKKFKIK